MYKNANELRKISNAYNNVPYQLRINEWKICLLRGALEKANKGEYKHVEEFIFSQDWDCDLAQIACSDMADELKELGFEVYLYFEIPFNELKEKKQFITFIGIRRVA